MHNKLPRSSNTAKLQGKLINHTNFLNYAENISPLSQQYNILQHFESNIIWKLTDLLFNVAITTIENCVRKYQAIKDEMP